MMAGRALALVLALSTLACSDGERIQGVIHLDPRLREYIVKLVNATRTPAKFGLEELAPLIQFGASPRASIVLAMCSRANAFLQQRGYVTPADIKAVAPVVLLLSPGLRHRQLPSLWSKLQLPSLR